MQGRITNRARAFTSHSVFFSCKPCDQADKILWGSIRTSTQSVTPKLSGTKSLLLVEELNLHYNNYKNEYGSLRCLYLFLVNQNFVIEPTLGMPNISMEFRKFCNDIISLKLEVFKQLESMQNQCMDRVANNCKSVPLSLLIPLLQKCMEIKPSLSPNSLERLENEITVNAINLHLRNELVMAAEMKNLQDKLNGLRC